MPVELSSWELLMLAGPILGNLIICFLSLWTWNPHDQPQSPRPQPRLDGPERIPLRRNKPGTALSDFVRAMREEDVEPSQTATSRLTPGIPSRIRIPSPKPIITTPLFPLSAPLSDETAMTPRTPLSSTFSRQMHMNTLDASSAKSLRTPFPAFNKADKHEDGVDQINSLWNHSPPSYSERVEEARSIPLPLSPIIEANIQSHNYNAMTLRHPGSSRCVRSGPHARVVSTGAQLFPIEEQDPLSSDIELSSLALEVEGKAMGRAL